MTKYIKTTESDGSTADWDVPDDYELTAGQEWISEPTVIGQASGPIEVPVEVAPVEQAPADIAAE